MHLLAPDRPPLTLDRPRLMGVLNVTPDSFSDGGRHVAVDDAVAHGLLMARQGAAIIDVGGESTRPGASRIDDARQIERTRDVIRTLRSTLDHASLSHIWISIDTTRRAVAEAALDAGASLLNDVSAGVEDPGLLSLAAERGVPVVLMHMQGQPATMQRSPHYDDVTAEVLTFLLRRRDAAIAAGIPASQIILDPGLGFGKTFDHNLKLLRNLPRFVATGHPILLGASRKRFLRTILETNHTTPHAAAEASPRAEAAGTTTPDLDAATAALTAQAVRDGVQLIRVHEIPHSLAAALVSHRVSR